MSSGASWTTQDIKRTIEVLGKEVIPELAAYQPKTDPVAVSA